MKFDSGLVPAWFLNINTWKMYDGYEETSPTCSLVKLQAVHLKLADMAFYITFIFYFFFIIR